MNNKTCTKCNKTKPLQEFVADKRLKTGYASRCKECEAKLKRAYYKGKGKDVVKQYQTKNKAKIQAYNREYHRKLRAEGKQRYEIKYDYCLYKGGACESCGLVATLDNAVVFDFHHVDETQKEYTVSDLINVSCYVLTVIDYCTIDNTEPSSHQSEKV